MTRYALYNGDLGSLLENGTDRPKLRLILRARAKAKRSSFVEHFVTLYRQVGEGGLKMSAATEAVLQRIADGPPQRRWS